MNKFYLLIAGTAIVSAIAGASLATVNRLNAVQKPHLQKISSQFNSKEQKNSSLEPFINSEGQNQTTSLAKQSRPTQYRRQPIALVDEVTPGSDFSSFRQRLRQAVQTRNAQFLRSILPIDRIGIGQGAVAIADLKLENRNAPLWLWLEKALAVGCVKESNSGRPGVERGTGWICNNVPQAFARQYPSPNSESGVAYELSRAIVVGNNVNVRARPTTNSPVVGVLSNEVVRVNRQIEERQAAERSRRGEDFNAIDGWTAIFLPNGRSGYVYNRYAYFPLEYRAEFGKVNGKWQLLYLPGGD